MLFGLAWLLAYSFRFEFAVPDDDSLLAGNNYALQFKLLALWVIGTHLLLYWAFRLYQGLLRYAGTTELRAIGLASFCHLVLWGIINALLSSCEEFFQLPQRQLADGSIEVLRIPFGILAFYFVLSIFLTGALRFGRRILVENSARSESAEAPATLIVGAGDLADSAIRSILRSPQMEFRPVCAVAELPNRVGLRLHGVPVVGTIDKIPIVIRDNAISLVLIAADDQSPRELQRIVSLCETAKVTVRFVPSLKDIAWGRVGVSPIRAIEVEDLLGRQQVQLTLDPEQNYLKGEVVLITGAGGSIGSELARQAAKAGAGSLILLGRGENSIFEVHADLRRQFPTLELKPVIADVRDVTRLEAIFRDHRPTVVFHAAAHKHVPLMEEAPDEAIKNNVFGTANVVYLADLHGVKRFVFISSDKAVRPVSVMGATKRLAERIVLSRAAQSQTTFAIVRFGNVLGSRGSVIPFLQRQIEAGGPLTITHPDVTRFFMTIPEAVSLVLQAGAQDQRGVIYLLDMGESVRIADLARNLIVLSGLRPEIDIKIEYIGLRPGEKLREELLTRTEGARPTPVDKLLAATAGQATPWPGIEEELEVLQALCVNGSRRELTAYLCRVLPDYHPPGEEEIQASAPDLLSSYLAPASQAPSDAGAVARAPVSGGETSSQVEEVPTQVAAADGELGPAAPTEAPVESSSESREAADLFEAWDPPPAEAVPATTEPLAEQIEEEPESDHPTLFDLMEDETPGKEAAPIEEPVQHLQDELIELEPEPPPSIPEEKEAREEMSSIKDAVKGPATLLMRVSKGADSETLGLLLKQLRETVCAPADKVICLVTDETKGAVPAGQAVINSAGRPQGAAIAEAIAQSAADGLLITLPNDALLKPGALAAFRAVLNAGALLAYSHFDEDREGKRTVIEPHDHDGCPHERFEFGPVIAYSIAAIKAVGGVRADLQYAWEYDLHLKLMEKVPFARVPEVLYTHFLQVITDSKGSKVFSPGGGPLGGFSYVFYPPDLEKEVTGVFEEALKRRGAWLTHETATVDYKGRKYEVLGSVVIPILNRVKYIGNAIEKLQKGTFQNFEIVIVDNGSTDGTIDKVKSIAAQDPRVRLLHGTGGTIASALNEGIRAARGKYICQLDSDDEYTPDCLESMLGHLESHPKCGLAISYYRLMDEGGTVIEEVAPITHSGYSRNQVLRRDGAGAVRIFPKIVLEEFGLYDEVHYGNFGEDYDMVLKVGEKYDVDRVHKVVYHYRRHSDNTDVTRDPKMKYHNKNHSRQQALKRRTALNKQLGLA